MKRLLFLLVYVISFGSIMAGCGSLSQPTPTAQQEINLPTSSSPAYPTTEETAGPDDASLPTPILTVDGPNFSIEPLAAGDTVIRGTGPYGIVIELIDVSTMGQLLGTTQIGTDGTFEVTLDTPLPGQQIVAIALPLDARASVDALNVLREKVGERPREYPEVGFVYDSEVVQK